jgi:hypothetical protein
MSDDEELTIDDVECLNFFRFDARYEPTKAQQRGCSYDGPSSWCTLPDSTRRKLAEGHGILTLGDGSTYVGNFAQGQRHGYGKFTSKEDDDEYEYEGEWRENLICGVGKMTFPSGKIACEKYVGDFVNDMRHGKGKLYDKTGALIRAGEWRQDKEYEPPPKRITKKYVYADRVRGCTHCCTVLIHARCSRRRAHAPVYSPCVWRRSRRAATVL